MTPIADLLATLDWEQDAADIIDTLTDWLLDDGHETDYDAAAARADRLVVKHLALGTYLPDEDPDPEDQPGGRYGDQGGWGQQSEYV